MGTLQHFDGTWEALVTAWPADRRGLWHSGATACKSFARGCHDQYIKNSEEHTRDGFGIHKQRAAWPIMIEAAAPRVFFSCCQQRRGDITTGAEKVDTKGPGEPRCSYLYLIIITEYRQRVDGSWSRKHRNYKHQPIHCGHPGALFITKVTAPSAAAIILFINRRPKNELGTKIIMWITQHNSACNHKYYAVSSFTGSLTTNSGHFCSFFIALMLFFWSCWNYIESESFFLLGIQLFSWQK